MSFHLQISRLYSYLWLYIGYCIMILIKGEFKFKKIKIKFSLRIILETPWLFWLLHGGFHKSHISFYISNFIDRTLCLPVCIIVDIRCARRRKFTSHGRCRRTCAKTIATCGFKQVCSLRVNTHFSPISGYYRLIRG